jgi:hypothetical protein
MESTLVQPFHSIGIDAQIIDPDIDSLTGNSLIPYGVYIDHIPDPLLRRNKWIPDGFMGVEGQGKVDLVSSLGEPTNQQSPSPQSHDVPKDR